MYTISAQNTVAREATFVRLGGLDGLVDVWAVYPDYLRTGIPRAERRSRWRAEDLRFRARQHGGSHQRVAVVLVCTAFFAVGMYTLTGRGDDPGRRIGFGPIGADMAAIATRKPTDSEVPLASLES